MRRHLLLSLCTLCSTLLTGCWGDESADLSLEAIGLSSGQQLTVVLHTGTGIQETMTLKGSSTFKRQWFETQLGNGQSYRMEITGQPEGLVCTLSANASGTITTGVMSDGSVDATATCTAPLRVYVANEANGTVQGFNVATDTGALSATGAAVAVGGTGSYPKSLAVSANGRFAYVGAESENTIYRYAISSTGVLSGATAAASVQGPLGLAVSPDGGYLYVAEGGAQQLSSHRIDSSTGALAPVARAALSHGVRRLALDPSGRWLLVTSDQGELHTVAVDPATGALTAPSDTAWVDDALPAQHLAWAPGGGFVYLALGTYTDGLPNGAFQVLARDADSGALSASSRVALADGLPVALALSGDGRCLLSADGPGARALSYQVDSATGALTAVSSLLIAADARPVALTVPPGTRFLHVANAGDDTVSAFRFGADCTLTRVGSTALATGAQPEAITSH